MENNNQITLFYSGNDFKYETEATIRLFIKQKKFCFSYDEKPETPDFILIRIKEGKKKIYFTVYVHIDDIRKIKGKIALKSEYTEKNKREYVLCTLLYELLSEITGKVPKWGMITGIRPVKKVNSLIENGKSKTEIYDELKNKYRISREKFDLCYDTAITQQELLKINNPKQVALYISIPFCPTRCSYCSFVSQSIENAGELIQPYLEKLLDELKIYSDMVKKYSLILDSVYVGGGTPTILNEKQLEILLEFINSNFDMSSCREFCVEAGRPDTITYEKCKVMKECGVSRVSVNPQTMNDSVLEAIGRKHTSKMTEEAFKMVKSFGFDSVNMDLIAGLPTDTENGFCYSLDKCIELGAENITVHTLTLKRSAKLFENWKNYIETPVEKMVEYSQKKLYENGYSPYYLYRQKNTIENLENVGYALKGKASLYNILIMEEIQTILGAGCGASTKLVDKNGKITRIHNYKFPYEYIRDFDKLMKKKNDITAFIETL